MRYNAALMNYVKIFFLMLCFGVFLNSCKLGSCGQSSGPGDEFIAISYELNQTPGVAPSYQTVVWLEDANGVYLKSVLVSEYLAYGGYRKPKICSIWSRISNWAGVSRSEFDAVTAATPDIGENTVIIDCKEQNLSPGVYYYCVQTHIIEDYDILYRGRIEIGKENVKSVAKVEYIPGKCEGAENALGDVKARYSR